MKPGCRPFLTSCAYEIMLQHLPKLSAAQEDHGQDRELTCIELVYGATSLVQGEQALSNHRFVHEPALVADVWLRLRWYLAHCSEQVMQLMGGYGLPHVITQARLATRLSAPTSVYRAV